MKTGNEIAQLKELLEKELYSYDFGEQPAELYDPIYYILKLGGKRLRPILCLLSSNMFSGSMEKAIKPSLAVEVFHNFSLVHDDIMDEAPMRRGKVTVHEKWNTNIGILSGDVMLVKAYELLLHTPEAQLKEAITLFNQCACEVCEGQQWDMNFETRDDVTEDEYLKMIAYKTAVLLGFSLELGALIAGANEADRKLMQAFGVDAGVGFQLKDDLLDVYGDQEKFGKQVGGDIIANKKTFLLIKAFELANEQQKQALTAWVKKKEFDKEEKVKAVTALYDEIGIKALTEQKITAYFDKAYQGLNNLSVDEKAKAPMYEFLNALAEREH